jgi:hypothetical protein
MQTLQGGICALSLRCPLSPYKRATLAAPNFRSSGRTKVNPGPSPPKLRSSARLAKLRPVVRNFAPRNFPTSRETSARLAKLRPVSRNIASSRETSARQAKLRPVSRNFARLAKLRPVSRNFGSSRETSPRLAKHRPSREPSARLAKLQPVSRNFPPSRDLVVGIQSIGGSGRIILCIAFGQYFNT